MNPSEAEKQQTHEEQLRRLYLDQKHTLDLFLERGAISRAQYEKSLGDLTRKMGFSPDNQSEASEQKGHHCD